MPLFKGQWPRDLLRPVVLAVLTLFCGCRTPQSLFTATVPGWHIRQGQALWRPERGLPEFGGDLVLVTDTKGRALIEFDKTPLSMVFAQVTPDRWLIRFPQKKMNFSGYRFKPARFAWLYLPAAVGGRPLPKPFDFKMKSDGTWRLENTRTGELIEGYLSP